MPIARPKSSDLKSRDYSKHRIALAEAYSMKFLDSPGDLKTRKRTGTSCEIEIHFSTISYPEPAIFRGKIESSGIIRESG